MDWLNVVPKLYGLMIVCFTLLFWVYAFLMVPVESRWKLPGIAFVVPFIMAACHWMLATDTNAMAGYIYLQAAAVVVIGLLCSVKPRVMYSSKLLFLFAGLGVCLSWPLLPGASVNRSVMSNDVYLTWVAALVLLATLILTAMRTRKWSVEVGAVLLLLISNAAWCLMPVNLVILLALMQLLALAGLFKAMVNDTNWQLQAKIREACAVLDDFEKAVNLEVKYRVFELERAKQRLVAQASSDALTGALNKKALLQEIERLILARDKDVFCLLMFDLDEFKKLNDEVGHQAGDMALRRLSKIVKASIREGDSLGRYGGDEFMVVLPYTPLSDAKIIAERIRKRIEKDRTGPPITISMGIAAYPLDGSTVSALIKAADQGLYLSKKRGRNAVSHVLTDSKG